VEASRNKEDIKRALDLRIGVNHFGKLHHPAIGVRIPEIFIQGIMNSLQKNRCAAGIMLSHDGETAPEEIIQSPPGRYEITLGHTGTSVRKYMNAGIRQARSSAVPIEMESENLPFVGSYGIAIKNIEGVRTPVLSGLSAIENSLRYNLTSVEEAISTGNVRSFSTDTSDLFIEEHMKLKMTAVRKRFLEVFDEETREFISKELVGKFRFKGSDGKTVRLELNREKTLKLAIKYSMSINVNARMYKEIENRMKHPFSFEISIDEGENITQTANLFIYLSMWRHKGLPLDYIAPNVGFEKRQDYSGDLKTLTNRTRALNAVANHFDTCLSFRHGGGYSPFLSKGDSVYETLLECTGHNLKYKVSGIYFELLMELLASHKKGTDAKILFELIFKETINFLKDQVLDKGALYSNQLKKQMDEYENENMEYDPRADVFRYHSYICLNFRDSKGRRYFRERLIRLYTDDLKFRKQVDIEMEAITSRLLDGLKFSNNY
jgi:tagaturonate epimerase